MRGISTQAFMIEGEEIRCSIDLVRHKLRLPGVPHVSLNEHSTEALREQIAMWLKQRAPQKQLEAVELKGGVYDTRQAKRFAEALWWYDQQFRALKNQRRSGTTSPILLYPHHFDLSLVWFPHNDDQQLSIGWSTGDEHVAEPYLYFTIYPEPQGIHLLSLSGGAYWQREGFSGAVLPHGALSGVQNPGAIFHSFGRLFQAGGLLLG